MKLRGRRKRSRRSLADQDEYQPFLSQPTLFIPNPPPNVRLQHIANALNGYGTSIHSIFFISVRQRPRLGKFSDRSIRRRWVRVDFPSIELAEQATCDHHHSIEKAADFSVQISRQEVGEPSSARQFNSTKTSRPTPSPVKNLAKPSPHASGRENEHSRDSEPPIKPLAEPQVAQPRRTEPNRSVEYASLLEALESVGGDEESLNSEHSEHGSEEYPNDNTLERILYPIDEETEAEAGYDEDSDKDESDIEMYSDAQSLIDMLHKFESLNTTQHEIDTANTTVAESSLLSAKPDLPSPARTLRRSTSTISSIFRENVASKATPIPEPPAPVPEPLIPILDTTHPPQPQLNPLDSHCLVNAQTSAIISLRKDLSDLLKAADSQTLIIQGLRTLIRQLEWDKSDLRADRENGICQVKLMQIQIEEMQSRMGFVEAQLDLAETKCRIYEGKGKTQKEDDERGQIPELEVSCRRLADMISHDAHQKHLMARRERVRLRETLVLEKARHARELEERTQLLLKEEAARKVHETEDRQRREKDRRRKLRREQAEAKEHKRCRERDVEKWGTGEWSSLRAVERFRQLLAEFESVTFTEDQPLTMGAIPWPILTDPFGLDSETLEDLEWGMVETFFKQLIRLVDIGEYKTLLERTNVAFHPDRWKSRRIIDTVVDEDMRGWLEAKGNMVAQAVTPLWRESRRYVLDSE